MDQRNSGKKKKRISAGESWTAAGILAICVLISAVLVGTSIRLYANYLEPDSILSVMQPDSNMLISIGEKPGTANEPSHTEINPSAYISDDKQKWQTGTQIDLFSPVDVNEYGETTVISNGQENLVAPGMTDSYLFYVTNDGNTAIDYSLLITVELSDSFQEFSLPMQAKVCKDESLYLCGSEADWESLDGLHNTTHASVLGPQSYEAYELKWNWEHEGNQDELDTLLGNMAVDDDLIVTIRIQVIAEHDPNPKRTGGKVDTSSNSHMTLWISILIVSVAALLLLLVWKKRSDKKEQE